MRFFRNIRIGALAFCLLATRYSLLTTLSAATNSPQNVQANDTTGALVRPTAFSTYLVPSQTGHSGKFLTTNGTVSSWATIAGGGDMLAANNLSDLTNAATARTNLGLAIGTNVQAFDADLSALAALSGTDTIYYRSASNTWSAVTIGTNLTFAAGTLSASGGGGGTWGSITGTLSNQTDLNTALSLKATLASPTFTGTPAAPTAAVDTNTTQLATTAFVIGQSYLKTTTAASTYHPIPTGTPNGAKFLRDDNVWTAIPGGGDALTASPLSQFAATTSSQLKGVLSDELGHADGKAIFAEGTLAIASGKTLTASNTLTFAGTDSSTLNIGAGGTLGSAAFTASSAYQAADADLTTYAGITPSANVQSLLGAADYSAMRTQLSLVPGTNVQAYDADLTTYAGITPSANVQTLLGSADYSAFRTSLSLVIGTNIQAYDADLTTYAGITPSANIQTFLAAADYSAMRTQLGLVIGTNVQAYDADLTTYAGTTPGTGVMTFVGTPTSANLAAALTNETGTGLAVFGTDPIILRPNAAMGALEIDVTKERNTKTATAAHTLTFSATPSAGQKFGVVLTGDSVDRVITIPSSYSLTRGATITSFTLKASSKAELSWVYDGTTYFLAGDPTSIIDLTTATPVAADDYLIFHDITDGTEKKALITTILALGGGGVSDGDKGDITVSSSGAAWAIDSGVTLTTPTLSGIVTTNGAQVTTANAMGALAIDVTKGLNTKTISADQTFTFSGTPATSNTWFSVAITNSDGSSHTATIPSSKSIAQGSTITTVTVPASGLVHLTWRYDGTNYWIYGDPTASGSLTDGDKGDITVASSGASFTIDSGSVSLAKMSDMATASILGRNTGGTGAPEVLSASTTRSLLSLVPGTDVQAYDADLTTYAGITPSANVQTLLGSADYAAFRSSLGVTTAAAPSFTGIMTSDGAQVTTANAMGALAIDVTKGVNTKTVSTDSTFTFSGTPATANTWFSVIITNSDSSSHVMTIPSSYSLAAGAAITTATLPASGKLHLTWRYDGTGYSVYGDPVVSGSLTDGDKGDITVASSGAAWTIDSGAIGVAEIAASTSADLRGVLSDESGTGAAVFAGGDVGAATATTPSANDNDTSVATTAYVQTELTAYASDTKTLANTRVTPRTGTVASSGTPTINTDNVDIYTITALAANITSFTTNLSGTPTEGQKLMIRILDNGSARTIAWGASFASRGVTLPTTTVISKYLYVGFIWNSVTSTWDCIASAQEA